MDKPILFYFVHAHGHGHKATFSILYPALSDFFQVIAITTHPEVTAHLYAHHGVQVLELPPKYPMDYDIPEHTFSKAFEVTPYATEPAERVKVLAEAIIRYAPCAFYCDGVPELAIMVRGMGVPVVMVHLPGKVMRDPTQVFAHELADHIVAHFPAALEQTDYAYASKTFYSGYLSKYSGDASKSNQRIDNQVVTILLGYDNWDIAVLRNITSDRETQFCIIGNKLDYDLGDHCRLLGRVDDISKAIAGSVVVSAAGQNSVAELLSLGKQLVVLAEPRPYNEQLVHAHRLADQHMALLAQEDFTPAEWQMVLKKASETLPLQQNPVDASAGELIAKKMNEWYGRI